MSNVECAIAKRLSASAVVIMGLESGFTSVRDSFTVNKIVKAELLCLEIEMGESLDEIAATLEEDHE